MGRDCTARLLLQGDLCFNPRAPCGARHAAASGDMFCSSFQSTRPVWGATRGDADRDTREGVSIHAPRVGRDTRTLFASVTANEFQSTRPVRGATRARAHAAAPKSFQSTRPVRGATVHSLCNCRLGDVSIHAPRVGRDTAFRVLCVRTTVSIHAPRAGRDAALMWTA